jgi:hypothetical protein
VHTLLAYAFLLKSLPAPLGEKGRSIQEDAAERRNAAIVISNNKKTAGEAFSVTAKMKKHFSS